MPNHVTNVIETHEKVIKSMLDKNGLVDFCKIIDPAKKYWGTKRNAYGQNAKDNTPTKLIFQTAWKHPIPIIKTLSEKFPEHEIKVNFADEDIGKNCGYYTIKNGFFIEKNIAPKPSDMTDKEKSKWREFAFKLAFKGENPKDYGFNENFL